LSNSGGQGWRVVERPLEYLRLKLQGIAAQNAVIRAHPEHDADLQTRWAAHMQLLAVIEFLQSDAECAGLISDLHLLQEALLNVADGRRLPSWLNPAVRGARRIDVVTGMFRGRIAAVMDFLMKHPSFKEKEAAAFVVENSQRVSDLLGTREHSDHQDLWRIVQDWRQKVIGNAEISPERRGFEAQWDVINQFGFGQGERPITDEAKKLLRGLDIALAAQKPS
jgi:hypothetical protein